MNLTAHGKERGVIQARIRQRARHGLDVRE